MAFHRIALFVAIAGLLALASCGSQSHSAIQRAPRIVRQSRDRKKQVTTTIAVKPTVPAPTTTSLSAPPSATAPPLVTSPPPTTVAAPAATLAQSTAQTPVALIGQIADLGGANKVITVDGNCWTCTTATLTGWQRQSSGAWNVVFGPWSANVGYTGWAWTPGEAQGFSPIGSFTFGTGFGTDSNPGYALGWFTIGPTDYWVEDPAAGAQYNTHQIGPADESQAPWHHFERLIDSSVAYQDAAFIEFNWPTSGYGRGSGIFLHVSTGGPTAGCVSLPRPELLQALSWIDGSTRIIMGPDDTIRSL